MSMAGVLRLADPDRGAALKPKHSLIDQSLHSRLGARRRTATASGSAGTAWATTPGVFHSVEPAWNDRNLHELSGHIVAPIVFAHIRASSGSRDPADELPPVPARPLALDAQRPDPRFSKVKRELALAVDPTLYREIEGSTDSELFFYLALTLGLEDDPPGAVERAVGLIEAIGERQGVEQPIQMTVATSDGSSIWAFRYSSEGSRARSSSPPRSRPCASSIRTAPCSSWSRTSRGSSSPSRSATCRRLERGARVELGRRPRRPGRAAPLHAAAAVVIAARPAARGRISSEPGSPPKDTPIDASAQPPRPSSPSTTRRGAAGWPRWSGGSWRRSPCWSSSTCSASTSGAG